MEKCIRAVISGKVQGVYFRVFTLEEAERLGLSGWVRNLASGEVEALVCGPSIQVDKMVDWFSHGAPQSRVDHVALHDAACPAPLQGFTIRYD